MSLKTGVEDPRYDSADEPSAPPATRGLKVVPLAALSVLALVITSVGVGIAVPRLGGDDGDRPLAVVGVIAVVIGGTAALWCLTRLLQRVRRRWWLLLLPAFVLTACLALWAVGQGVAASFPARSVLGTSTPADVGLPYESVSLRTDDRVQLAAWWVPSENGAAVVLLPGAGSTRTDVLQHAKVLGSHGYGVLLLDFRGHGGSAGRGMDFGWYGPQDVAVALDFVAGRPGMTDRIGIVGLSMGGEVAIGTAGVDPRVRAVVAEGATNWVAADKGYLAAYGFRGELQRKIDWATYAVAGLLTGADEPASLRDSARDAQSDGTPTPLLLVTAGEVDTERLAAEFIDEAAPDVIEIWTVPGAGHTGGLRTAPGEWEGRVLSFLDGALGGAAAR